MRTPSQFIQSFLFITCFCVGVLGLGLISGCPSPSPVTESRLMLGTSITISLHDKAPRSIFEEIWTLVQDIESRMSINATAYDTTELMQINRSSGQQGVKVSDDTLEVIKEGIRIGHLSDGAFDITIAPLVSLWQIGQDAPAIPGEEEISAILPLIEYSKIQIDSEGQVFLPHEGMGIDLGGVAKGYAAGKIAELLKSRGISHALLDFGGDIAAVGSKPNGSPWRIGIQDPAANRGILLGIIEIADQSVVTSGVYERYFFLDGIRYHHILDPDQGYPVRNGLTSVTVITKDPATADALSTAAFVLGLEKGTTLIASINDTEAIFVYEDKQVFLTDGLQDIFELTSEEYAISPSAYRE